MFLSTPPCGSQWGYTRASQICSDGRRDVLGKLQAAEALLAAKDVHVQGIPKTSASGRKQWLGFWRDWLNYIEFINQHFLDSRRGFFADGRFAHLNLLFWCSLQYPSKVSQIIQWTQEEVRMFNFLPHLLRSKHCYQTNPRSRKLFDPSTFGSFLDVCLG